jgi:hypothetical protein
MDIDGSSGPALTASSSTLLPHAPETELSSTNSNMPLAPADDHVNSTLAPINPASTTKDDLHFQKTCTHK